MLADPQSITINAVAKPMARTQQGPTQNVYVSSDGLFEMTTKQNATKSRFRREIRIAQSKVAADPISAVNALAGTSVYLVVDEPRNGVFSDTEIGYIIEGLKGWLTSANYNKVLVGEF